MRNIILLVDHILDPRLKKKILLFKRYKSQVSIFQDESRGSHVGKKRILGVKYYPYYSFYRLGHISMSTIYISGVKVMIHHLLTLLILKQRNLIVLEVPDLPMRSRYALVNKFYVQLFSILVKIIAHKIVVTSNPFKTELPRMNTLLVENIMKEELLWKFLKVEPVSNQKRRTVKIGVVGALRYVCQLEIIFRYVSENDLGVELHIYGGPEIAISSLLHKYNNNIFYWGVYDYDQDIIDIYKRLDYVYAVYDAMQPNVKMALPNKLYECGLAHRRILVAENTYLSSVVEKNSLGLSLPSSLHDFDEFRRRLDEDIQNRNYIQNNKLFSQKIFENNHHQQTGLVNFVGLTTNE